MAEWGGSIRVAGSSVLAGARGRPAAGQSMQASDHEPPDSELIRRVAAKNDQSNSALELLFRRHSQPLLRFVVRTLRNEESAEDLVHDVFIRVAESARSYRGESSFRTWLFTLALNLVRSRQRRSAVEKKVSESMGRQPITKQPIDPAESAERRELCERVDGAIAGLAESERETFLLYWFGQMSYAEISETTGISIAAAKVRVHRALARLSRTLA
jgi:RNA polymerase sigma-70 factor (ECF subfamily)